MPEIKVEIVGKRATDILTPAEAAAILGSTEGMLAYRRSVGGGPAFIKIDGWRIGYAASALIAWIEARGWAHVGRQKHAA